MAVVIEEARCRIRKQPLQFECRTNRHDLVIHAVINEDLASLEDKAVELFSMDEIDKIAASRRIVSGRKEKRRLDSLWIRILGKVL